MGSWRTLVLVLAALAVATAAVPPSVTYPQDELEGLKPARRLQDDETLNQLSFWIALNEGKTDKMREAHDRGADPEDRTEPSGYRPIHLAAAIGNLEALLLLIEYGVDVNAQTTNGTTALHYAANHGDVLVSGVLLAADANPDLADNRGFVPLHFAAYANQYQFETRPTPGSGYVSITREASTEVSQTSEARSKSTIPGMGEFIGCVELYISFKANVDAVTDMKETPLHYTPAFDQYESTLKLIEAHANVNAQDEEGETPLHEATAYDAIGVTQLLLMHGADLSAKDENGMTARDFICRCRQYRSEPRLTQCAPGKCTGQYDYLVLDRIFRTYSGEGN